MNEANDVSIKQILLATDLSARCDRALDRAIQLARQWGAELTILHAVEPLTSSELMRDLPSLGRADDRIERARHEILDGMPTKDIQFSIAVEEGEPAALVLRAAERRRVDLIVVGTARYEPWGRMMMGSTVDTLARRASVPILVVKMRAKRAYERGVVATDFSEASRQALEIASRMLPDAHLMLFHAFDAPPAALADASASQGRRQLTEQTYREFVATADITDERRRTLGFVVEDGRPAPLLLQYVQAQPINLIVLGSRGQNLVAQLFLGSTTENVLNGVPCDVLVVPKS